MDGAAPSWFLTRLVHIRASVLGALVILSGLMLNLTVLGANPVVNTSADPQPAPVGEALTVVAAAPTDTVVVMPGDVSVDSVPSDTTESLVELAPDTASPVAIVAPKPTPLTIPSRTDRSTCSRRLPACDFRPEVASIRAGSARGLQPIS